MATTMRISTGALAAERTFSNDAAAQAVLLRYADYIGATGTNQQKLQAIVDWLVEKIQTGAAEQQFSIERDVLKAQITQGNQLT